LQTFLRRRVPAYFELEQVERLADLADLDLRGVGLGLLAAADEVAADDAEHDADQHEDDQDFDQGHPRHVFTRKVHSSLHSPECMPRPEAGAAKGLDTD